MDDRKMEIIQQLMEELQSEMEYGEDDLASRLGREKPKVEVMSVETEDPEMEEDLDLEGDMMGEEVAGPEEKLKQRLMKLRG